MKWSESRIASALARQVFQGKHLVVVPNCSWPGSECDLLVVTRDLRIIDVEIKISRSDFKADAKKDKWFHNWDFRIDGPYGRSGNPARRPVEWPRKVWKHYYAMPKEVWAPEMVEFLPSPNSGVILITENAYARSGIAVSVERVAKPCRDAKTIAAADAIDIARLASLRMWDAFDRFEHAGVAK